LTEIVYVVYTGFSPFCDTGDKICCFPEPCGPLFSIFYSFFSPSS